MTKQELMQEIDGYAVAKATGFPLLIERQLAVLQTLLAKLPDQLPEITEPPKTE